MKRLFSIVLMFGLFGPEAIATVEFPEAIDRFFAAQWPDSGFTTVWEPLKGSQPPALPESTELRLISPEPLKWQGPLLLTFKAEAPGFQKQFSIRGILRVFGPGLLPSARIHRRESLSAANVHTATVEWTRIIGTPLRHLSELEGKVAARTLVPGRPIIVKHICLKPVIEVGQEIFVEAVAGNVRARTRARVLEAGAPGEIIRVILSPSSKRVRVRLQDTETAELIE